MNVAVRTISVSLLAVLALSACSKNQETPAQSQAPQPLMVKIGQASPLTGPQAAIGKDNENGARLAIEDANAAKIKIDGREVQFELMSEDDQADPKQGTLVAQKFVDAKVNAVIGHLNSGTSIPASKIYSDAGIAQVSPSATNPAYTRQGFKTTFRVMANDEQQGKALAQFAASSLKAKTVAIIDDKTAYGEGLAGEFSKMAAASGIKVVATEHTDDKSVDFAAILTKIKATKPDIVFYGGMYPQAGPMVSQMKKLSIPARLLTGDGGCAVEFLNLAGAAAEGHYCSLPGVPLDKMPGGAKFEAHFKTRFNIGIQQYAPNAYDAVMVVVEAIKRANSADPAKIVAELPKTSYAGVTSSALAFDANGDIKDGAVTIYQYTGGAKVAVETIGGVPAAAAEPAKPSGPY